jgi:electron transfer flavoprotein alpha subunit
MATIVFVDSFKGYIKKSAFESLTYAKKAQPGQEIIALVAGDVPQDELEALGQYGASKVWHASGPAYQDFDSEIQGKTLAKAAEKANANLVILPFDHTGKSIAPIVAVAMNAGLVSGATSLPDTSNGFTVKVNVFSGKALAEVEVLTESKVITVNPNSIPVEKEEGAAQVEPFDPGLNISPRVHVKAVHKNTDEIPLPEAERVVSAGRGLKGPENWGIVEDLAKTLDAATACSRPVSDIGWRPHHEHVGQTGITIRPNLYIAAGISGAIQHLAGVNGSKTIVVINTDPEAPFFKAADYGVVGDAFEVLPKLNEAVRKFKEASA